MVLLWLERGQTVPAVVGYSVYDLFVLGSRIAVIGRAMGSRLGTPREHVKRILQSWSPSVSLSDAP